MCLKCPVVTLALDTDLCQDLCRKKAHQQSKHAYPSVHSLKINISSLRPDPGNAPKNVHVMKTACNVYIKLHDLWKWTPFCNPAQTTHAVVNRLEGTLFADFQSLVVSSRNENVSPPFPPWEITVVLKMGLNSTGQVHYRTWVCSMMSTFPVIICKLRKGCTHQSLNSGSCITGQGTSWWTVLGEPYD